MPIEIDPATGLVVRPAPEPFPLGPPTMAALLDEIVASATDRLALIDEDRTFTFGELDRAVDQAATALVELGVGPGDRVAWSLPNCAELPIGFLASQRIGAIWMGINLPLAPPEKQYLLDDAEVSHYIATAPTLREVSGNGRRLIDPDVWAAATAGAEPLARRAQIDPHAPAAIAYTSGTSGRPKGAVHSQHNLLWPGLVTIDTDPPTAHDRQGTPLAHTILNMLILGVVSAWARGGTGVILRRRDAVGFSTDVARHALTRTTLVPPIVHDLVHQPEVDPSDLASLESVIVGGAATAAPLRRAFAEKFGLRAINGYGLSEAPSGIVREALDEPIDDGTGYALAPFELVIVGENDAALPPGAEGEICVRATTTGPWARCWSPTLGYWKKPDATSETLRGGLLHTADIGHVDGNGRLTINGRRSELILRGGANIHPAEVEMVMALHEHVADVAVLGVDDDRLGQRVAAVITAAVDRPDTDAIRSFCADRLAAYKIPDVIVVADNLPRNAMGKVMKADIRVAASEAMTHRP